MASRLPHDVEEESNFVERTAKGKQQAGPITDLQPVVRKRVIIQQTIERVIGDDGAQRMPDDGHLHVLDLMSVRRLHPIDGGGGLHRALFDLLTDLLKSINL